ncbi:MAG: glycosyltransferase family 39 protein [Phycisphaerae bacterium]
MEQPNDRFRPWWLIALLGVSLAIRLFFAVLKPLSFDLGPDAYHYAGLAKSLLHTGTFPSALRSPGYPVFVAGIWFLFSETVRAVLIVQAVLSTLSVGILYLLGVELLGKNRWKLSLVAAALVGLNPDIAAYSGMLLRESLTMFLLVLSTWLALRIVLRHSWYALPLGLSLSGLVYVRMEACLLIFVILAGSIFKRQWTRRVITGGVIAGGIAAICAAPWILHCARHRGYANMQDAFDSNLFCRTWYLSPTGDREPELRRQISEKIVQWKLTDKQVRRYIIPPRLVAELAPGDVRGEADLYRKLGYIARENMKKCWPSFLCDSLWYLKYSLGGYWLVWWEGFWDAPSFSENLKDGQWVVAGAKVFCRAIWPVGVVLFSISGLICIWRQWDSSAWLMLLLFIGTVMSLILLALVTLSEPRLRIAYDGFLSLFLVYGIHGAWRMWVDHEIWCSSNSSRTSTRGG